MRLDALFTVRNGIATSELSVHGARTPGMIPFLRPASTWKRTIAGYVLRQDVGLTNSYPSHSIFVSTNGEGSHTYAYVSNFEFAANSDVSILIPKRELSLKEKLWYAFCITFNRPKFSYGRKPKGERLKKLEIPDVPTPWLESVRVSGNLQIRLRPFLEKKAVAPITAPDKLNNTELVPLDSVFDVIYGSNLELNALTKDAKGIKFVSRTSRNNGVSARVDRVPGVAPIPGGVLSVAGGGSVLETFLQKEPFYSGRDLFYLRPRITLSDEELLFYALCIRANAFKYSYGRQANRTLRDLPIPASNLIPAWVYGSLNKQAETIRAAIVPDV